VTTAAPFFPARKCPAPARCPPLNDRRVASSRLPRIHVPVVACAVLRATRSLRARSRRFQAMSRPRRAREAWRRALAQDLCPGDPRRRYRRHDGDVDPRESACSPRPADRSSVVTEGPGAGHTAGRTAGRRSSPAVERLQSQVQMKPLRVALVPRTTTRSWARAEHVHHLAREARRARSRRDDRDVAHRVTPRASIPRTCARGAPVW